MARIGLKSYDGVISYCLLDAAKMSVFIKNILEDSGETSMDGEQKILNFNYQCLTDVVLKKIIQWVEYHWDDPILELDFDKEEDKRDSELSYWDNQFINISDKSLIYDIIDCSNYLDIKGLLEVGAKHICNLIKGKNCIEVRKILNIKNDFTPEEEEAIHKEVEWLNPKEDVNIP